MPQVRKVHFSSKILFLCVLAPLGGGGAKKEKEKVTQKEKERNNIIYTIIVIGGLPPSKEGETPIRTCIIYI